MENNVKQIATEVIELLRAKGYTFATAESCTGGAVAGAVTRIAGCSDVMLGGVVAYHNNIKHDVLGVDYEMLREHGAVSEEVVREMVIGVSERFGADCAVATSGVAGPGGGTPEKPVGTVWVAVKAGDNVVTRLLQFQDCGRENNIQQTVCEALRLVKVVLCASSQDKGC